MLARLFSLAQWPCFAAFALLLSSATVLHAEDTASPWMTVSEMNAYLEGMDGEKPGGKNFWDRGHWLTSVEGRWEAGVPQYRVSYAEVPESRAHWWQWFLNLDRQTFDTTVGRLADDGYTLVQFSSYTRPGGSERFQAVWHKRVPLMGAALLPAGEYRLSEIGGQRPAGTAFTLKIEGERMTGAAASCTYTGSVRDRFSGKVTTTDMERTPAFTSREEATMEREFFRVLEYASWSEEGGRLRLTKDGRTVLRFERAP